MRTTKEIKDKLTTIDKELDEINKALHQSPSLIHSIYNPWNKSLPDDYETTYDECLIVLVAQQRLIKWILCYG